MLLPVEDALAKILSVAKKTDRTRVDLHKADGMALADDLKATLNQPPFAASAMDGYAVRHEDLAINRALRVIGEASAGHRFPGSVSENQAVRIFTGAPMPEGTDTVIIQEDVNREENTIKPTEVPPFADYVRPAGGDFGEGTVQIKAGTKFDFRTLSLAAAMNHPTVHVYKKPRVGVLSNGDELVTPGDIPARDQIISSNAYGVASIIRAAGGVPVDLGIARDNQQAISNGFDVARNQACDIIVTLGGASVGDHDLIKPTLAAKGIALEFWKIAMRPGKPFMFGTWDDDIMVLGMPGNPVSSLVCSLLFLRPLILAMQGLDTRYPTETARLGEALGQNSHRQAYLRAHV